MYIIYTLVYMNLFNAIYIIYNLLPNTCKKQDKLQLLNARSAVISTEKVVNECLIHLPLMLLLLLLQLLLLLLLLLVTLTAKKGSSVYILPLSSPSVSPSWTVRLMLDAWCAAGEWHEGEMKSGKNRTNHEYCTYRTPVKNRTNYNYWMPALLLFRRRK